MKQIAAIAAGLLVTAYAAFTIGYNLKPDAIVEAEPVVETQQVPVKPEVVELDAGKTEDLVNDEREKAGLARLTTSEQLRQSACLKLNYMITHDYWNHIAPDGTQPWFFFEQVGYYAISRGENQAYGQLSEVELVNNWMDSPSHKDNIIDNFTEHGVCTAWTKFQDKEATVTVHHFGLR